MNAMDLIILCGSKNSGKTSTGRELSKILKVPFYDLDQLIEKKTGQSVRGLYKAGEALFQRKETAALEELFCSNNSGVLAASGGIIDNPGAMVFLGKKSANHCTIYLEVTVKTAWQRIVNEGELPPFLDAPTLDESEKKHRLLHERRAKEYKKIADHCISAEGKNEVSLAEELCNLIQYKTKG